MSTKNGRLLAGPAPIGKWPPLGTKTKLGSAKTGTKEKHAHACICNPCNIYFTTKNVGYSIFKGDSYTN